MAYPVVNTADTKSGTVTTNLSSWTLTYPTSLVSGDLLVSFVAYDGAYVTSTSPTLLTWPTGWITGAGVSAANGIAWAAKIANGTETGAFSITLPGLEQGAWIVYRITGHWNESLGTLNKINASGANTTTAWYGECSGLSAGNGASGYNYGATLSPSIGFYAGSSGGVNPRSPDLNPVAWGAGEETLWFSVCSVDTSRTFTAGPTGNAWTGAYTSLVSGGTGGVSLGVAQATHSASTASEGTGLLPWFVTTTSDDWIAITLAVRPAPAAGHSGWGIPIR